MANEIDLATIEQLTDINVRRLLPFSRTHFAKFRYEKNNDLLCCDGGLGLIVEGRQPTISLVFFPKSSSTVAHHSSNGSLGNSTPIRSAH